MIPTPKRSWFWRIVQVPARIASTLMFDLKVWGLENVPKEGGAILLCNHQSYLDPVLFSVRLKRPVTFMAKSELFEQSSAFEWLIRSLHAFPIRKGTADIGALKQAISKLEEGNLVNVYPEGTRTPDGEIHPMLPGVTLIIRRANAPIIPAVIDGSFDAWSRKEKNLRMHPIRIMYGPPLDTEGLKGDELIAKVETTLRQMLIELRKKG